MKNVNFVALSEICTLEKGKTGLMKAVPGQYPLVATGKDRRTCNTYQFDTKAVCIPLVSSTGHGHASLKYVHYQEGKFALGTILVAVIPKDENILNAQFLHLYLSRLKDEVLVPLMTGAANVTLTVTKLKTVKVPLPPIEEQLRIVSLFNRMDNEQAELTDEISNQQVLLKKLRQSILQEAIEGKLTASWREQNPDVESASMLLEKIKAEKEQLIKEKKIKRQKPLSLIHEDEIHFDIIDSWEWCRLGEVIDLFSDYHANGSYKILKENVKLLDKKDYAIMLRTTNFHTKNKYNYKYINKKAYNFLTKTKLYSEDIIMNKIADPGKVFFVQDLGMPMSLAMNLFLLRFDKSKIVPKYVFHYLINVYDYIVSFAAGSSTLTITKDSVNSLLIPIPPFEEQKEIVKKIESLFKICDELEIQINSSKINSEILMQAVLKEAFEG